MPTYGYQCIDCKHEFSVFQAMKDDPISLCPECSGPVKRLLYPVGVVFKGSGWYINDSRKPDTSEQADSSSQEKKNGSDSNGDDSKKASGEKPETEAASDNSSNKSNEAVKPTASSDTAAAK